MNLAAHERIVREALGDGHTLSEDALAAIVAANKRSDLFQFSPERHFDNARDRTELGERWRGGLHAYLTRAVACCTPVGNEQRRLTNRGAALRAFGAASHALADFYAHTNWVELWAAQGVFDRLAPLLGNAWDDGDFPPELQSGYFSLRYGLVGCPRRGGRPSPPRGYAYCHAQLAKDDADRGHGAERTRPAGPTFHEVAVRLAVQATREAWQNLRMRVLARYGDDGGPGDLFAQLAWGRGASSPHR
jgi:hypothetical protein